MFHCSILILKYPSIKDYNSAKSNACHLATEEGAERLKSDKHNQKTYMFPTESSRYPGPQTRKGKKMS